MDGPQSVKNCGADSNEISDDTHPLGSAPDTYLLYVTVNLWTVAVNGSWEWVKGKDGKNGDTAIFQKTFSPMICRLHNL